MKRLIVRCISCAFILMVGSQFVPAAVIAATPPPPTTITIQETPPPSTAPALILSSIVGSALPQFVELFNQSDAPINLSDWQLTFTIHDTSITPGCVDVAVSTPLPAAWMLSKHYLTLEQTTAPNPSSLTIPFALEPTLIAGCLAPKLGSVVLAHATDAPEQAVVINLTEWSGTATTAAQHRQRSNSLSSTRAVSGIFDTDYKIATGAVVLNSDPLYMPPVDSAGLQVQEILPNARDCSPLEADPTCSDYVKLYNPTDQPINLALYRLRSGTKVQSESITNTFTWNKAIDPAADELLLPPQAYLLLVTRNDGQPLTLTDSGNYVWLEDAYGTTVYEPIIEYPDASSTAKVGQAWAYDGISWQWTSAPQPTGANYFPPVVPPATTEPSVSVDSSLKPCADGQYRNPATNRCNTIVTAVAGSLAPCDPGEERNPATNRCRSVVSTTAAFAPCDLGEERNPETNRCRKTSAVAGASTAAASVKDIPAPTSERTGWLVAALVTVLALVYAAYEWRQDIRLFTAHTSQSIMRLVARRRR